MAATVVGFIMLGCVGLTGCGFHPLYGDADRPEFDERLASVAVLPIAERIGQILANSLRDSFNPTGAKVPLRYTLAVTLTTSTADYAIRKDGTASRELLVVSCGFQMLETGANNPVLSGSLRINDSYDVGGSQYSVIVANSDAQTRAAQELSADIRTRVALYLRRKAAKS